MKWDEGPGAEQSSEASQNGRKSCPKRPAPARTLKKDGDLDAALKSAAKVVEASYSYPFISHARSNRNCSAQFKDGKLEIWSNTQQPARGRALTSKILVFRKRHHDSFVRAGGSFGRGLTNDYMVEVRLHRKEGRRTGQACLVARRRHDARLLSSRRVPFSEGRSRQFRQDRCLEKSLRQLRRGRNICTLGAIAPLNSHRASSPILRCTLR